MKLIKIISAHYSRKMVKSGNSLKSDISKEVDYENVADEFAFIKARKGKS